MLNVLGIIMKVCVYIALSVVAFIIIKEVIEECWK